MPVRQALLDALMLVKDHGPKDVSQGICTAVAHVLGHDTIFGVDEDMDDLMLEIMSTWPKNSGSMNFPVPGTNGKSYIASYVDFRDHKRSMWDPKTEYGCLRLELLDHCIAHLQQGK